MGDDLNSGNCCIIVPVHLNDPVGRNAPASQTGSYAKRGHDGKLFLSESPDRFVFKMVIVIVGNDHEIQLRDLFPGEGGWHKTADDTGERGSVAENRIHHETDSPQLKDQ